MIDTQNNNSISLKQHQKAMSVLEKRLAKINAKLTKAKAKAERDRQKAQDKLNRTRQQAQVKLDRQKKKDQEAIDRRVAKYEAKKVKETQQRENKEAARWEKEILKEEKRQTEIRDSQRWKGSKKLGKMRKKLNTQLTKIRSRQDKIYNPTTGVKRDGKIGRSLQDRQDPFEVTKIRSRFTTDSTHT